MTKINEWLNSHPEVRSGIRVAVYTFIGMFSLSLIGFLGDVQQWATSDNVVFPAIEPLGKALAAAVTSALSGLISFGYNKLPSTKTAIYPANQKKPNDDRGAINLRDVLIVLAIVVLVLVILSLT